MIKIRSAVLLSVLILAPSAFPSAQDENKPTLLLIAYDQIEHLDKKIIVKGKLISQGILFRNRPVSGERIEFYIDGRSVGIGLSGGDGIAVKEIGVLPQGEHAVALRLKSDHD